ncbi:MAG TPA: right-handed parallel beta-helix repeat-containing protein [Fimbriimonadaceae bacterium]|nr:right-handed parallel beta-helix repeat-containing protein [Fimbriimonadaceae bacterium]
MVLLAVLLCAQAQQSVLTVGDGETYSRIEAALAAAKAFDTIQVYPSSAGYGQTALRVTKPGVVIVGMGASRIKIDGTGYDYTGAGSVPRAIFQVEPKAKGVQIRHFELTGAHNDSYNGAGVRINQASNVTVEDCDIHGNDMGIMSNGTQGDAQAASNQVITHCVIHGNGNAADPGYNHNLYLGGTSVTVEFCEIYGSLTGHNLKSRAHYNLVRYCYIHDSANRECDFPEAWDTQRPNSNAVLIGDVIVKDPNCPGNRETIHFGVESGSRNGTLYLVNDTIVTPFLSGVVALSTSTGSASFQNSVVVNTVQNAPNLLDLSNGGLAASASGRNNWISRQYDLSATHIDSGTRYAGGSNSTNPLDSTYRLLGQSYATVKPTWVDGLGLAQSGYPTWIYSGNGTWKASSGPFIGAG